MKYQIDLDHEVTHCRHCPLVQEYPMGMPKCRLEHKVLTYAEYDQEKPKWCKLKKVAQAAAYMKGGPMVSESAAAPLTNNGASCKVGIQVMPRIDLQIEASEDEIVEKCFERVKEAVQVANSLSGKCHV